MAMAFEAARARQSETSRTPERYGGNESVTMRGAPNRVLAAWMSTEVWALSVASAAWFLPADWQNVMRPLGITCARGGHTRHFDVQL